MCVLRIYVCMCVCCEMCVCVCVCVRVDMRVTYVLCMRMYVCMRMYGGCTCKRKCCERLCINGYKYMCDVKIPLRV